MHDMLTQNMSLSMQTSGIGSLPMGSMPTPDSTSTASSSDEVAKDTNAPTRPDVELGTASETGVYVTGRGKRWSLRQKCDCMFKKSCIVYTLILTSIWILFTVPIIAFYATSDSATGDQPQPITSDSNFSLTVDCTAGFYVERSSGLCRPECGEWDQYSTSTRRTVYGINITFVLLTILICVTTIIWSIFRRKIMFRFPNILLVYITISRLILSILHVVGYTDEKALYCTSRNRVTSFEEDSPYCNIIGSATTFVPGFNLIALCYQLGTVLFGAYFPFRAREFKTKHRFKYVHLVAVVSAIVFPGVLVGVQYGLGGYSRTVVPIFCLADASSAFLFAIIPTSLINAIFLTFVMMLLFKVLDISGWKLRSKTNGVKQDGNHTKSSSRRYTSAQVKLVVTLCAYGVTNYLNYAAYSVVVRRESAYSETLDQYFACEAIPGRDCDRSTFENLDPTSITFPLTTISYIFPLLATLIYVSNFGELYKKCVLQS